MKKSSMALRSVYWAFTLLAVCLFWFGVHTRCEFGLGEGLWVFAGFLALGATWAFTPTIRKQLVAELFNTKGRSLLFILSCFFSLMTMPMIHFIDFASEILLRRQIFVFYVLLTIVHLVLWRVRAPRWLFLIYDSLICMVVPITKWLGFL